MTYSSGKMKIEDRPEPPAGLPETQKPLVSSQPGVASYATFFRDQYPRLVRTLFLAGASGTAEDLAQEAFAIVLTHWGAATGTGHPDGYLFRCAFRLLAKEFKARRIPRERFAESDSALANSESFEETVCALEELEQLVNRLPPRARACAVASFSLGMKTEEIAKSLNITAGTVRKHLSDARASLRSGLGQEDHSSS